MSAIDKKVRRDVVPRWRLSASQRDLDSLPGDLRKEDLSVGFEHDPARLLREFEVTGKPLFASEALSSALVLGDHELAGKAAQVLSKLDLQQRPVLAAQVGRVLDEDSGIGEDAATPGEAHARFQIQRFKRIVRGYPRSPLAWLDLAFSYSAVGQTDPAKNAVLAAVSLEPNHRSIVRAASRFFLHKGELDRALAVISKSNLLGGDPWLVSAHIATSRAAGVTSELLSSGRKMFKNDNYRPDQISELGAALATNELEHGNARLAHRLVNRALQRPTENAVAQVGWLESVGGANFDASEFAAKLPNAWEARTFDRFEKGEWRQSCEEAKQWLLDQPFSSRPAVHGSYVAATFLEDYVLSLSFAQAGYLANPDDVIVANNYSVALAETGRVVDARRIFEEATRYTGTVWRSMLRATDGLLLYREGHVEAARLAYDDARSEFSARRDSRSGLLASVYQAREEVRLGNVQEAKDMIAPLMELATDARFVDHEALKKIAQSIDTK